MRLILEGDAPPGMGMRRGVPALVAGGSLARAMALASGVSVSAARAFDASFVALSTSAIVLPESRSSTEI